MRLPGATAIRLSIDQRWIPSFGYSLGAAHGLLCVRKSATELQVPSHPASPP